jgi:hypothetical protein
MTDKTTKNTLDDMDAKLISIAAGLNSLMSVHMQTAVSDDDGDMFAMLLASMANIVRAFEGVESAKTLIDGYTNGAYSKMDSMVDAGVSPEEAATIATKEDSSVH